jgi:hypothetical protein
MRKRILVIGGMLAYRVAVFLHARGVARPDEKASFERWISRMSLFMCGDLRPDFNRSGTPVQI